MSASATEAIEGGTTPDQESWSPGVRGWVARAGVAAVLVAALVFSTALAPENVADLVALAAIYALAGVSLNVILGYAGQLSLGHHGLAGVAAFVSAALVTKQHQSFVVGLTAGVLTAAASAALLGSVALRLRGLYLPAVTLVYGFVVTNSVFRMPALSQAGGGTPAPRPHGFVGDRAFASLCLFFLAVALAIDWRIASSKLGRALAAVRHSDATASAFGINPLAYRLLTLVLSGGLVGLAGGLLAHRNTVALAADFDLQTSLVWIAMVVVGGLGRTSGVVLASAFFAVLPSLLGAIEPLARWRDPGAVTLVVAALAATIVLTSYRAGVSGVVAPVLRWLRGQRLSR